MKKINLLITTLLILILAVGGCNKNKTSTVSQAGVDYVVGQKQTTNNGLNITFIKIGSGKIPKIRDKVRCDYVLKQKDGTEIDSSYVRGNSIVFAADEVIEGLREALLIMPTGSKVNLVIPPDLAYGAEGVYPHIKPNETLLYEVVLHSIE